MSKYLVETYYTCTFKVNHYLDDINETELKNLEKRDDGKFEVLDVKLDNRKTKSLDPNTKKNDQNKYVLKCDPRWESACFKLTSHEVWFDLKKINIPIKIILTPNSVVCNETSQNRIKKLNPQTEICFIDDTSHMLPLEKTEDVASEINNFLT